MEDEERGMEAVLRFPLPECQQDFEDAVNGDKWQDVVWDLIHRSLTNSTLESQKFEDTNDAIDYFRSEIIRLMDEKGLQFHG